MNTPPGPTANPATSPPPLDSYRPGVSAQSQPISHQIGSKELSDLIDYQPLPLGPCRACDQSFFELASSPVTAMAARSTTASFTNRFRLVLQLAEFFKIVGS